MTAEAHPRITDEQWLALNGGVIAEFRANGGVCGGRWEGNPMVLLTTIGARSGKERTSPLTYTIDRKTDGDGDPTGEADRLVLIASRAGDDRHPDWFHNLVANPDVIVELGAERFAATATVVDEPERTRLMNARIDEMPRFGDYAEQTDRTIPVVVVTRTGQ
jgi:deazaflavin-dependent oxidoreductase (nitroreductase family)